MRRFLTICTMAVSVLTLLSVTVVAQIQVTATDMTPTAPLPNPSPGLHQPRYISGFGSGDSFTLFFEDRAQDFRVHYLETTDGINGLPGSATPTDLRDTHLCVKDWPINIGETDYAYRAWGALWNTADHHFYVSNGLESWKLVSTFTIPTLGGVSGQVFYGFHDVIQLNGKYYAWGECNIGYTLMCCSANGADDWEAFARVGGLYDLPDPGPLKLPGKTGPTPTGSFFELGGNRGYGKIMAPGDDSALYLAINTAAKPNLSPEQLAAAFIDPANWTWHDGTTDYPPPPILEATPEHDYCECWLVPDDDTAWIILYDADFGSDVGGKALGYAILSAPLLIEVSIDIKPGSYPNAINKNGNGVIPVAILGSADFDVKQIDVSTLSFAGMAVRVKGNDKPQCSIDDVSGDFSTPEGVPDGYDDLVCQFVDDTSSWTVGDGEATLTGQLLDGTPFEGTDSIKVVQ